MTKLVNIKEIFDLQILDESSIKPNIYLFMDLYQMAIDIKYLSTKESIFILIGDTPSYLTPFLRKTNSVFNLPFSNKPYGCFFPPHSESSESYDRWPIKPKKIELESYFNYLNNKTWLTVEFVKNNWNNIILVDSSAVQSISGVSIFLNRYIGNLPMEGDCYIINGAKPLKFIQLTG